MRLARSSKGASTAPSEPPPEIARAKPALEQRLLGHAGRWWHGCWLGVGALTSALALSSAPVVAHPLGNFSISHYSSITIAARTVDVRYALDLAEIPTFQEIQETGIVADAAHPSVAAYALRKAETLKAGLRAEIDGRPLSWQTEASEVIFPPGAGGLPTLKIGVHYRATLPQGGSTIALSYRDTNYADRAGWKEIVAVSGPGVVVLDSSVPETDRSRQLADYPTDLLDNPPQVVAARVAFARERPAILPTPLDEPDAAGAPPAPALEPNRQATPRDRFTELMTVTSLSPGVVMLALVIAAGLGAFHALEPGHGKTMVAAYLVGARGTAWHALLLGLIVTASHTAGVYLLGGVTLYASRYVVPERIYPWLGVVSGLMIAGLGIVLFLRRYAGGYKHGHDHGHGHGHSPDHSHGQDHAHDQDHGHDHAHEHGQHHGHALHHHDHDHALGRVSLKQLFVLGVTGGIVPCPAALVVLLSALSLGRVGLGLVLIVAFSLGLAAVLIATGILVVYARQLMACVQAEGRLITRWLPLTSAAVIIVVGLGMTTQALQAAGILQIRL
jgi:nickel/cobalt exporter